MTQTEDLPMAPSGCTLDERRLGEQLDRYRQLSTAALRLQERELELVVTFSADVDVDLLELTVATERTRPRTRARTGDHAPPAHTSTS
jgi:hypothetical protein